ncbi:hypothetical protein G7Y89_g4847 [Cudoniella acicularis]|uniref:Uncharacterized protein n=1 Tax=Cudoniella acicularis TaxID=354080 RepID=A0A8H4RNM1_9HELO|nr:hypothetical protein G7Y89_g4847 [Cudoniella acicularis]
MAADSNRDKDSNNTQPKQDNPFIKFKQFADAQIGSLLQGILGLPSTFSKNGSADARWADFDSDMRRRDELQARQQQLRDAEARRTGQRASDEEQEIPVKKWIGQEADTNEELPREMDEQRALSLPLYSPVTKELFAHLLEAGDSNSREWKPSDFIQSLTHGFAPDLWPLKLQPHQKSSSVMRMIQHMANNELNCGSLPSYASEYSLLPYLLFSPYSPLKLSFQDRQGPSAQQNPLWCAAFEDLITTVHGRPPPHPWTFPSLLFQSSPATEKAADGMHWISQLYNWDLLQQKEAKILGPQVSWPDPFSMPIFHKSHLPPREIDSELDTYDHFLRWFSSTIGASNATSPLFPNIQDGFRKNNLEFFESPEARRALREMIDAHAPNHQKDEMLETFDKLERLAKNQDPEQDTSDSPRKSKSSAKTQREMPPQGKLPQDSKRVMSTSTTSEQHTSEDGSVETTVTVWKRFADGSESWTTSTHCSTTTGERREQEEEIEVKENNEQKSKKGWFWN